MARRRFFGAPAPRSSIGDSHVDAAIKTLTTLSRRSAAAMTSYTHSIEGTVAMLFDPDTIDRARAARGIIEPLGKVVTYPIHSAHLTVDYAGERTPPIMEEKLSLQPSATPLLQFIKDVREIYLKFEEVKAVLRWLNRNATPGAIRFYFPTAMKLCPNAPVWRDLQEVPSRYIEPVGVGDWIQSIKDATATIAASALLPGDVRQRENRGLRLTFNNRTVQLTDRTTYDTDQVSYNI